VPEFADPRAGRSWLAGLVDDWTPRLKNVARAALGRATVPESDAAGPVSEDGIIDAFVDRVSVEPVRASRLVDVNVVSADPLLASRAANTLADQYVGQNLELRQQTMAKSLGWISEELVRQQHIVEQSERAMAEYRASHDAGPMESPQNIVVARLSQLNDAATRARTTRAQKESLYRQIESLGEDAIDTIPAVSQNPYIQTMKTRLADLQRDKALLSERYGEKHPEIVTITASIQDVSRGLESELAKARSVIRHEYESAVAEERTLASALDDQKAVATNLDRRNVDYTVLERNAHSNRELFETLLQREKELQVLANSRGNNVRLVEHAGIPGTPFRPDIGRSLLLGSMAGLLLALGLVVGLDYIDDTVKTADDITRRLGLACLGMVPAVDDQGGRPVLSSAASGHFGEAIRSLRTSVAFCNPTDGNTILLIASAQPLEGKTTTACNLAAALAYGGSRVLLIDADMRRPSVHDGFGLSNGIGLSDLLNGRARLQDVVKRLSDPGIWVMTAGTIPENPSELLGSSRMGGLLSQLRAGPFDWVIIDSPPVLAVTDAAVLAPRVSGVVFVLGAGMTRRRFADRAIDTVAATEARILGAVLNRVDVVRDRLAYSEYYGYQASPEKPPARA
jgi:capsular exopolysaccharide synthesis family protein